MLKKGLLLVIISLLIFSIGGYATDYTYSQQSGAGFFVGTADKADALEDNNELRQIVNDLGTLLGHSKMDGAYPADSTTGGTLGVLADYYLKTAIDTIGEVETIWITDVTDSTELATALTDYYLKTAINTLSKVETIYGVDITTSTELATYCETTQNYLKTSENSDSDDDVTDDNVESMTTAGGAGTAPISDGAGNLAMTDIWTEAENTSAGYIADITGEASTDLTDTADLLYETELDSETELENQLTDTTNIYTNNDFTDNSTNWDTAYGWGNHASAGYLTVITGESIGSLSDVDLTDIANEKILQYNSTSEKWECETAGAGAGYTNLTSFVDQTAWRLFYSNTDGDVTELALGADGTYLKSNGAAAAPTFEAGGGGASQLSDLSDVGVTTPTDKYVLVADGDSFESRALVEADISDLGSYAALGANSDITSMTGLTTALGTAYGGTGVANNAASTITITGAYSLGLTLSANTDVTLPTTGTLATTGVATLSSLTSVGTITTGGLGTGAVLADVTMTLGSDADGDIYYRTGNKLTRLAKGTEGHYLKQGAAIPEWADAAGGGDALKADPLSQFAATTSAELAGVIIDEKGSGSLIFETELKSYIGRLVVSNWTIRTSAADNLWYSVCWSPELTLFVAVAFSGTGNRVMTSPDGINWTIRTSAADNNWVSVCWSPELTLFVAVAYTGTGNRVMTSLFFK